MSIAVCGRSVESPAEAECSLSRAREEGDTRNATRNVRNGREKVLFGTNYPMITPAKALADLASLALPDDVQEAFLSGNAKRVFDL